MHDPGVKFAPGRRRRVDARHFDSLARTLSASGSRRRFLALLAMTPVAGGLAGLFSADDAEGHGRRRRRVKRHKHGRGRRRKQARKRRCTPDATTLTCAGRCGSVTNNCKQIVNCGACDCSPACGPCFTCQGNAGAPGTCVVDEGAACSGDPCLVGQTCDAEGQCGGGTPKCPGQNCDAGTCIPLTCEEQCSGCEWCIEKADMSRMCGSGRIGTGCVECSSDAECPLTNPICVARITSVNGSGSFTPCPTSFPGPACTSFTACG